MLEDFTLILIEKRLQQETEKSGDSFIDKIIETGFLQIKSEL